MLEEPPEPAGLFVYGTLLFPEVLRALLGRIPDNTAATVAGWRAAALPGLPYPGLVPGPSSAVGRLLTGLTADEWRRLEVYEGDQYELRRLTLTDGRQSWAYVWIEEERVSPHDWRPEEFAARRYLTAPVTAGD